MSEMKVTFLGRKSVMRLSNEQLDTLIETLETDVDGAVASMEAYCTAAIGLGELISTLDCHDDSTLSVESLKPYQVAAANALRPIGMFYSDLGISMEDDKPGVVQRFKEMLVRLYNAVVRTAAKVWAMIKQSFSAMYSRHRELRKEIDDTQVALSKLTTAIQKANVVKVGPEFSIIGRSDGDALKMPDNFADLDRHMQEVLGVRKNLLERYAVAMAGTLKSVFGTAKRDFRINHSGDLDKLRSDSHRALSNFDFNTISRLFQGARVNGENSFFIPLTGGYGINIYGNPLPAPEDPEFIAKARAMVIDVKMNAGSAEAYEMKAMSQAEVSKVLSTMDMLVKDMVNGRIEDRVAKTKAMVDGYEKFIKETMDIVLKTPDESLGAGMREKIQSVFNEQTAMVTAFTAWGGPVFLKTETVCLKYAIAMVKLCRLHLRNMG